MTPVVEGVYRQQSNTLQSSNPELIIQEEIYHLIQTGLPEDSQSLRSCSGNRAKMPLKSHLGIKCHSVYIKVIRVSIVLPIVHGVTFDHYA